MIWLQTSLSEDIVQHFAMHVGQPDAAAEIRTPKDFDGRDELAKYGTAIAADVLFNLRHRLDDFFAEYVEPLLVRRSLQAGNGKRAETRTASGQRSEVASFLRCQNEIRAVVDADPGV